MRLGSGEPSIHLRNSTTVLLIGMPDAVMRYGNSKAHSGRRPIFPGRGRDAEPDAGAAAIIGPVVFAIDDIVAYLQEKVEEPHHGAIRARMFGGLVILRRESVVLLRENSIRIVLMVACQHGVGGLRPQPDRTGNAAAAIALLTQRLAIVDPIVQDIQLPILAPNRDAGLARRWNDVPVGRHSNVGLVCDRVRRVANDFAHLT